MVRDKNTKFDLLLNETDESYTTVRNIKEYENRALSGTITNIFSSFCNLPELNNSSIIKKADAAPIFPTLGRL